jgi:hypothetical protein
MSDKPAFLVFDVETVVDGRLVQRVRYPEEAGLTPAQAVAKQRAELLEKSAGKSDFIPHTFHVPVSVAVAKVGADFELLEVITLDRPKFRPQVIARKFWKGWSSYSICRCSSSAPTAMASRCRPGSTPPAASTSSRATASTPPPTSTSRTSSATRARPRCMAG